MMGEVAIGRLTEEYVKFMAIENGFLPEDTK